MELLQAKFQDDRRKVYLEEFQMLLIDLLQLDVSSDDNTTWNVNSKIRSLFQRVGQRKLSMFKKREKYPWSSVTFS